jgi:hypothetical protein
MRCQAHIRLTLTRSETIILDLSPRLNTNDFCLSALATRKAGVCENVEVMNVITSTQHRHNSQILDSNTELHASSSLHDIAQPVIESGRPLPLPFKQNILVTKYSNTDEITVCKTTPELTPEKEIHGRKIIDRSELKVYDRIVKHFQTLKPHYSEKTTF